MPPTDHRLTLVTKAGCHLCEEAHEVLRRIAAELGVPLDVRDIAADPADAEEYADRVPVVLLDGKEHGYWRVEEQRLRRDLAR